MGEQRRMFAGLCLCSTGLELDVKEQVRKIVVACGGQFQDDLDPEITTHLIAEAVGSLKHRTAVAHELLVVSPRWVFESFRAQKLLDVKDFGLRLLEGMGICTAGLPVEEKETVAQLATTHGAQYDGRLELGFTSVLIAQHPEGAKYEAAVANDIPVVHLGWLYACLEREMLVEEEEFALQQEADDPSLQPTYIAVNQQKYAQELVAALPEIVRKYHRGHKENGGNNDMEEDEEDWMDLFDGCGLYLLGFPPQMNTLLQRLIRTSMATIYHNVVIRQVSHVVVSASLSDKQTLEAIQARVIAANAIGEVHFVSASWLLDCVKCLDLQPEELYPVEFDVHVPEPAQGTSTTALPAGDGIGVSDRTDPIEQKHAEAENETNSGPIILSEDLLQNGDGNSILLSPEKVKPTKRTHIFAGYSFLLLCRDPDDKHLVKPLLKNIRGERGGAEAIAIADIDFSHLDPEQFSFVSHVVMCTGAVVDEREALGMQERIHQAQRELRNNDVAAEDDTEADGVDGRPQKRARHDKKPRQRMLQFVSDLWVNCSLAARIKLSYSSHELFDVSANRPRALFSSPVPLPGFRDVIASTSLYLDVEHLVVIELLRIAGAHVTRKLNTQNTHLICRKSESMKFVKATEWGLRVVKARWVVDSLLQGKRLSEDSPEFQVVDEGESSNFTHTTNEETILSQSSPRSASTYQKCPATGADWTISAISSHYLDSMGSGENWAYMDALRPRVYICLRRQIHSTDVGYEPMQLDGRVDKEDWAHVPWSEPFVDIEGPERKPKEYPLTRFKMMYDDDTLYVGAELIEPKIWGTITEKNSTMYHENDFEVFFNPDGSRHHYYEMEVNCLNTIWELLLHRPYKDGYSIENPFNLVSLRSAVFVDGLTNSPETECVRWCVEMSWSLVELQQFDKLRYRGDVNESLSSGSRSGTATPRPPSTAGRTPRPAMTTGRTIAGDVWRVNFSRVQYELETVVNADTNQLQYRKVPDKREDNIVWAPTGVIDIHRPERWGYIFFSSENELPGGELELAGAMTGFLDEQMTMERVLDAVYYRQRAFHAFHGGFASTLEMLYSGLSPEASPATLDSQDSDITVWTESFPLCELLRRYELDFPKLSSRSDLVDNDTMADVAQSSTEVGTRTLSRKTSRRYAPALDQHDEDFDTETDEVSDAGSVKHSPKEVPPLPLLSPRSQQIKNLEARGLYSNYRATVRSSTQEWNIAHDGRLWKTS